jgi:5-methylthioadenosine/S-adenosylhomocysteine deaminase
LLGEAQFCGLLHRAFSQDSQTPTAETLLRLATIEGARALGLDQLTGSLEPGKQADLIVIDLNNTPVTPVHDPIAAIVFSASACDVRHTVVAGRVLFDGNQVLTLNEAGLRARVNAAADLCYDPPRDA